MKEKKSTIITGAMIVVLLVPGMSMVYAESAPYLGNVGSDGQTGVYTLEEALKLAQARVAKVKENPDLGSGTPFLALDGAIGASILSAGIFGGISAAFLVSGRKGKYAAMGRG